MAYYTYSVILQHSSPSRKLWLGTDYFAAKPIKDRVKQIYGKSLDLLVEFGSPKYCINFS
jgi:hypothetical protein